MSMTFKDVIDLIINNGFAIAVCIYTIYNAKADRDAYRKDFNDLHSKHLEENNQQWDMIKNLTAAVTELSAKSGKE